VSRALRRITRLIDHDPEVRAALASKEDLAFIRRGTCSIALLEAACERYGERLCFRTRSAAISYRELWSRAGSIASAWHGRVKRGDRVGIEGLAGIDWISADLACLWLGAISVPLPSDASDRRWVIDQTEVSFIASIETSDERVPIAERGAIASIVHTSGSTGRPKGVIIEERRWASTLRDPLETTPLPSITVNYLPLGHLAGRIAVYHTMMTGGVTTFADPSSLFEDIRRARPTMLTLVPRVSNLIHQHFKAELLKGKSE
jgi:long-subunit acyl-CoA synthetase (AMP-forming)